MSFTRKRFMFLSSILLAIMLVFSSVAMFAEGSDTWTTKASMSYMRMYHQVATVDGKIYAIGGWSGSNFLNSVEEYDPVTNAWTTKAPMSTLKKWHKVAVVDGKIYAIGGYNTSNYLNLVEEYNPATNTWTTKAPMTKTRGHHQVVVIDGKIYAIGGLDVNGYLNSVEEYDPATNTWTTKAPMNNARAYYQVAVVNGKIYAIGGLDSNGFLNSVEEYNPATNTWTTKASMSSVRAYHEVAVVDGKIYVIGGRIGDNYLDTNYYLNTVEEYDPVTNTWTTKASMSEKRANHQIATVDGKVYAIGGSVAENYLNTVEEYNPATNTWTTKTSMTDARAHHQVIVVDGKIYATGGQKSTVYLNSVEEYTATEYLIPTAPTNLTATAGDAKVDLSWAAVTDATSYNIKRSTMAGGPYTTIASGITSTTYTDTTVVNGTTYYYVITAVNAVDESVNSNEASATPISPSAIQGNRAILVITMINGNIKEYDLSAAEIDSFLQWYDDKENGVAGTKGYFAINKNFNIKPFLSRKDYIAFSKIQDFEIKDYNDI